MDDLLEKERLYREKFEALTAELEKLHRRERELLKLTSRRSYRWSQLASSLGLAVGTASLLIVTWPLLTYFFNKFVNAPLQTWWKNILGSVVVLVLGFALFRFKYWKRYAYGVLEVGIGLATGFLSVTKVSKGGFGEGVAMAGAIYIIVRGLDNMYRTESPIAAELVKLRAELESVKSARSSLNLP